jgi:hypothetical protein
MPLSFLPTSLIAILLIALTASVGPAFAASGDGSATVSGFVISDISYELSQTNGSNISAVSFTATAADANTTEILANISARFDSASVYYICTRTGGAAPAHHIRCATTAPQLTVSQLSTFDTIITQ